MRSNQGGKASGSQEHSGVFCSRLISSIVLLLTFTAGHAFASLDPAKPLHQLLHQTWTTAQGLPQNSVLAMAQTQDGYLWLGTEEGLVRFDGLNFTIFDKRTSDLNANVITALLVDHEQNLWIGTTANGLFCLKNGKFTSYGLKNGFSNNNVEALYEDENGVLWIGTDGGGLIRYRNGSFHVFNKTDGLADNAVLSITGDRKGAIWIGTHGGLSRLKEDRFVNFGVPQGLASDFVRSVLVDREGTLWIGTAEGLCRMSPSGDISRLTMKDGLTGNVINRVYQDRAGTLWLGTGNNGLFRYARGRFEAYNDKNESIGATISSILEDREGDLWIGTQGAGLHSLRPGTFVTFTKREGLLSNNILGIYQDDDQGLWVGSDKGMMHFPDGIDGRMETYSVQNGLPGNFAFIVTKDREGAYWIATDKGLVRILKGKMKTFGPAEGMNISGIILCLFTDRKGTVWAGGRGGLSRFNGDKFVTYTTREGLSNNLVVDIYEDHEGSLWIGTAGGLNQFKNGHFRAFTTRDGLNSDYILSIFSERDGTLWIGTSGGGMSRFRNGKFVNITTETGLHDDSVLNIIDDHLGRFWMSSNKGIYSLSRKQLNEVADGAATQITPNVYGISDGMKAVECNGGFQNSALLARDGRIYFATTGGLSVVDPAHVVKADQPPQAVIEGITADNQAVDHYKAVVVPPGKGQLEFQFTAPSFVAPEKLQFRYMLEGFDKDWNSAGTRRVAYYTNIPHGEYRFRVRAGENGDWGPVGESVPLTLKPHFYQTTTFNVFLVVAGLSLAAGIYRLRVNQLKVRERKLVSLVNERTSALQESERLLRRSRDELEVRVRERTMELLNANKALEEEISVRRQTEEALILAKDAAEAASRAKSDFLANMSHEIRTPINGILGMTDVALSTLLDEEQREYLEIVKFSADSLLGIVNDILDFSKIEARKLALDRAPFDLRAAISELIRSLQIRVKQKGLYLDCKIADDVPGQLLGDPLRLRQVLLNLLDNAVKFTATGGISLSVVQEGIVDGKSTLHFAVRDTGIGIPSDKQKTIFEAFSQADTSSTRRYGGTGLGLTISYQLAIMMEGRLWVESQPGQGSTFHFTARIENLVPDKLPSPSRETTTAPAEA